MYATGIDLSEMKRVQIIELCNSCLADAVDLQFHCKHEHWNVKGPNFIALHQLFDQVNESVEDYIDAAYEWVHWRAAEVSCSTTDLSPD